MSHRLPGEEMSHFQPAVTPGRLFVEWFGIAARSAHALLEFLRSRPAKHTRPVEAGRRGY